MLIQTEQAGPACVRGRDGEGRLETSPVALKQSVDQAQHDPASSMRRTVRQTNARATQSHFATDRPNEDAASRHGYMPHPSFVSSGASERYREFRPMMFLSRSHTESFTADDSAPDKAFTNKRTEADIREAFLHLNYRRWQLSELATETDASTSYALRKRLADLRREEIQARNWIIEANQPLVSIICSRFLQPDLILDELCSEATSILLRAIDSFDVRRDVLFSTYATTAITRHLQRWIGTQSRSRSRQASLHDIELEPISPQIPSATQDIRQELAIRQALNSLPGILRRVVQLRFGLEKAGMPMSFRDIAERLGMSREQCRRLCSNALARLRTHPGLKHFEPTG